MKMVSMIEGEKSLRAVVSEKIHKAVEVYRRWSGSAVMPTRERLEPLDIPDLLPNIILIEVMPDARLSVRLAGEAVQVHFGDNYTGKYLDEIEFGEARSKIMNDYTTAHRERRAVFSDHKFRSVNGVACPH